MATWVTITTADIKRHLVAPQVTALENSAKDSDQTGILAGVIQDVIFWARGQIASCRNNVLDADTAKVPPSLKWPTIIKVIQALQTRLPNFALSESQKALIEDANSTWEGVRSCAIPVEKTSTPASEVSQSGSAASLVSYTSRKVTSTTLDGI